MFIYDGASAIIRKKNDSNDFKVRITKINESDTELILGLQLVEPKEDEKPAEAPKDTAKIAVPPKEDAKRAEAPKDQSKL